MSTQYGWQPRKTPADIFAEMLGCLALPGETKSLATLLPLGRSEGA